VPLVVLIESAVKRALGRSAAIIGTEQDDKRTFNTKATNQQSRNSDPAVPITPHHVHRHLCSADPVRQLPSGRSEELQSRRNRNHASGASTKSSIQTTQHRQTARPLRFKTQTTDLYNTTEGPVDGKELQLIGSQVTATHMKPLVGRKVTATGTPHWGGNASYYTDVALEVASIRMA
jgi:hypothetical protein